MFLSVIAVLATALLGSAFAQSSTTATSTTHSSSATGTSTSTSSAAGATHTCDVGAEGFNFSPNTIYAEVGDIIEYRFYPLNHSVARAGFKNPCIPYEDTGPGLVGFWSGFEPVAVVLSNPPIFRVTVNDTDPIFFYCSAPGACIQGMIGVINPNSTFNYTTQLAFALNTTQEFSPGEYFPVESLPTRTTTATGATSIPSATNSATSTPSATVAAASHSSSLSGGAIAGIAIGAAAVVVLAGALIYMCGRQKSLGEIIRHSHQSTAHPSHISYVPGPSGGMAEANYPNIQKTGHVSMMSGQYSDQGYHGPPTETESYRSMSPPVDERTGMMSVLHASSQHAMHLRNGQPSPGSPGSAAFPSPAYSTYNTNRTYEIDQSGGGLIPHPERDTGPHELSGAGPSPNADSPRPFSFTDSESGYRPDHKIDPMLR